MTTIAFKDGILAADTRMVGPTIETFHKWWRHEGLNCVMAMSGSADVTAAMRWWMREFTCWDDFFLKAEEKPELKEISYTLLTIDEDLILRLLSNDMIALQVMPDTNLLAIGYGREYAMGAMAMGANAKEAVDVATRFDVYTGGEIDVVDVRETVKELRFSQRVYAPVWRDNKWIVSEHVPGEDVIYHEGKSFKREYQALEYIEELKRKEIP